MRTETNPQGETLMWLETPFEVEFMGHFRQMAGATQRKFITLCERLKSGEIDAAEIQAMAPEAQRALIESMPEATL